MSFSDDFDSNKKKEPRLPKSQGGSHSPWSGSMNPLRLTLNYLNISIEMVGFKDFRRVAKTLTLSFEKDPFVNYILNTKISYDVEDKAESKLYRQKMELFQTFFEWSVAEYFCFGGVIVAIKDLDFESPTNPVLNKSTSPFLAVACWNNLKFDNSLQLNYSNPIHYFNDNKLVYFQLSIKFYFLASRTGCRQKSMKEKLPFLNNIRNSILIHLNLNLSYHVKFNSVWYLSDIGVLPSMAGKGLGKYLINYCYDNFINDEWCYLESSNIINRNFYKKMGFKIANTFAINEDEIVNNIDLSDLNDLNLLNQFDKDFILMDAMLKPPKNLNINLESKFVVSPLDNDNSLVNNLSDPKTPVKLTTHEVPVKPHLDKVHKAKFEPSVVGTPIVLHA